MMISKCNTNNYILPSLLQGYTKINSCYHCILLHKHQDMKHILQNYDLIETFVIAHQINTNKNDTQGNHLSDFYGALLLEVDHRYSCLTIKNH